MSRAYDKPEETAFHEWRKRVKDLGYQTQTLRELWPPVLKRFRDELDQLGDLLGKEHDLTLVRNVVLKRRTAAATRSISGHSLDWWNTASSNFELAPKRSAGEFTLKSRQNL